MPPSLMPARAWVAEDTVPDSSGCRNPHDDALTVVVRIDIGDGEAREIAWLNPDELDMDDVLPFVQKWRVLTANVGASFDDLIDYDALRESIRSRKASE